MRRLTKFIFISIAYISFTGTSIAQDPNAENNYRDVHWGLDEGLSQSIVSSMLQDVNGFLWVETQYGLDRFDGKTFKTYLHDSKKSGTIAGNNINGLIEDSLHNLWIGTDRGLSRYDIKADTFSNFSSVCTPFWATTSEVYCMEGNSVVTYNILSFTKKIKAKLDSNDLVGYGVGDLYTIYNAATNSVWFLKASSQRMGIGLLQLSLSDGKENFYKWPDVKYKPAKNNSSEAMKYDKKRNCIWINAAFGLLEFSLSDKKFHHIDALDKYVNSKDYTRYVGIDIDRQGRIWFATSPKGILIYNPADDSVTLPFAKDSVLQHAISDANACIYCDNNGIIWSGFWYRKGIDEILPFKPVVKHYMPSQKKDSLNHKFVLEAVDAGKGKVWVGTGGGINILDTKTGKFQTIQQKDLPGMKITGDFNFIGVVGIDTLAQKAWLETAVQLFKMDMQTKKCTPILFQDLDNKVVVADGIPKFGEDKIYLSTDDDKSQSVFALNLNSDTAHQILSFSGRPFNFMYTVAVKNKILFLQGIHDEKGNRTYENKNGKWVCIHTTIDSIRWSHITYNNRDFTYWIAGENQLFHYDKYFRILKIYTVENGMPELPVVGIIPDNNGNIWFHTDRSIQELNIATGLITTMSQNDGFEKQDFELLPFADKDKNGNIYFGGGIFGIGLTQINPNNLNSTTSSVYLKSLTINQNPFPLKQSINYTDTLSLKYNQTKFALDAGIIDFYSKGRSRLRYKLERKNSDEAWQYASYYYTIRYEGLQPGDYWLIMQASNASNEFNGPEKKLFIHISPPFWDTWWFRAIAFLCILALVFSFIQYRSGNLRKKNILLEEKVMHRTKELKHSLEDLRATQAQLIQSEKMASLGELTAGIAHEIQNPLNFVNNFSEVNKELLDELKEEADKGNIDEVKAIANDVIDNSKKINHHGQRADAIVKGMLQHSRQTQGAKEPTDINALCDEYLRLSYHGLRAKDKNFNADLTSDFDETIGKIIIVPQDIGRVMLNLFNNAFYAVSEKKKLSANGYQPTASVTTKKLDDKIEIKVSDNGYGIPQNIIDKIFQPFFTTKPTGEGTGLGLSLAYDIITKEHNGTINVQSKEGEGSTFTIRLPVV